jgi:hypothetical protein
LLTHPFKLNVLAILCVRSGEVMVIPTKVLDVLNYQLQRKITIEQLDKLNIKGQPH